MAMVSAGEIMIILVVLVLSSGAMTMSLGTLFALQMGVGLLVGMAAYAAVGM